MMEWKETKIIDADIEVVWELFKDRNIRTIMPKVEEHTLIEKEEHQAGAKHRQTYREGKRVETYIVETVAYEDRDDYKNKQIQFVLGKAFEIDLTFTLEKIGKNKTSFTYAGRNKGVNFVGRAMLRLGSKKGNMDVVQEFMNRVQSQSIQQDDKQ
ncbi:SRPBCC family protein [Pontibacillus salicampi]|uniref:SRPBCC family protein n=1 Tax=Pontibacillus salicampi TaxID=1449801 RepID=A0ABV6LIC6_9BACI